MNKINSIMKYSPGNCTPELLEMTLVTNNDLVKRIEKDINESVKTKAGYHWLLVGPRGIGKTHLLAVLNNRITANSQINDQVVIAYLKEEERGVATFLDWLIRILKSFEKQESDPEKISEKLRSLTLLPLTEAEKEAKRYIIEYVGNRRLLLFCENLGEIFSETKGMGIKGQRKFRDMIQQDPVWVIIATTQNLFDDIQSQSAPFYGFFNVHHLDNLTFEETIKLLDKLAIHEHNEKLRESLQNLEGRGKIKAIHEITSGNPRLVVTFYQFLDRTSITEISNSFLEMADNLTSYYQEHLHSLSAQQQKILEYLSEERLPRTVKEISSGCFITSQTASGQLKKLTDRKLVISTKDGRESYYELKEPLLRICFEIKENKGYPIKLFVDFLGRFYTFEELKKSQKINSLLLSTKKNEQYKEFNTELLYIEKTMQSFGLIKDQKTNYRSAKSEKVYKELLHFDPADADSILQLGLMEWMNGKNDLALSHVKEAEKLNPENPLVYPLLGELLRSSGKYKESISAHKKGIKLNPSSCASYFFISLAHFQLRNIEDGINQLEKTFEVGENYEWQKEITLLSKEINSYILRNMVGSTLEETIKKELSLFGKSKYKEQFVNGMLGTLTDILKNYDNLKHSRLEFIRTSIIPILKSEEPLSVMCRLFDVAAQYIIKDDSRILFELPLEERNYVKQWLKIK